MEDYFDIIMVGGVWYPIIAKMWADAGLKPLIIERSENKLYLILKMT